MKRLLLVGLMIFGGTTQAAASMCTSSDKPEVCYNMRHLRASINALDAQRELMQVNPGYLAALGLALRDTAVYIRSIIGPGIPEHHMGLSGVERLGGELATQAATMNTDMLKTANVIRNQCATCHGPANPNGGVDWDRVFNYDWQQITEHCNTAERNPYLCRSMNGMLSAYGYLLTGHDAKKRDFTMTRQAADEIARILVDLRTKGFNHMPEELRSQAEADARVIAQMAMEKNPEVFERATRMTNACQECHERRMTPAGNLMISNWNN
jgi:hypothetical protein